MTCVSFGAGIAHRISEAVVTFTARESPWLVWFITPDYDGLVEILDSEPVSKKATPDVDSKN